VATCLLQARPPLENQGTRGFGTTPSLLPSLAGIDLQNKKRNIVDFTFVLSPDLFLGLILGLLFFPYSSGGRSIMEKQTLEGGRRCCCDGEKDNVWLPLEVG
jgi:hypothetical protein